MATVATACSARTAVAAVARVPVRLVLVLAVTVASAGVLTVVHDTYWAPQAVPAAAEMSNTRVAASAASAPAPTATVPSVPALDPPGAGDVPGRSAASTLPLLDREELAATAERVRIPERAVAAYASAALQLRHEQPGCGLTWVTLAGIGWVESRHGAYRGSQLRDDGSLTRPIIGVPLDGGPGVRAIPDTDGGRYDGDATWDRAVGPMQFIPSTWARYGVDANGSGAADPQHIDDAALAAARYLCASGRDLTQGDRWVRAVRSYNRSDDYVRAVLTAVDGYAARANG